MPITYSQAGVDIDRGDALVERIKKLAAPTRIAEVVSGIGGFAGLCALPSGMVDPILVSGTDGVGTKLEVAFATGIHDTIGIDLVAMCVNDIITCGARPLFFLDYFATGKLDVNVGESVVRGIAEGCKQAGCALLGGETAEMPGMYEGGKYDLAGFAVGIVERAKIIDGSRARPGDVIIGVASSGLHSNGFSLTRKVLFDRLGLGVHDKLPGQDITVGESLLVPTRIYVRAVRELLAAVGDGVRGLSHITGGGLPGNVPRVLPDGLGARIDLDTFERPAIFRIIAEGGPVEETEMLRTYNVGVGLVIILASEHVGRALDVLEAAGETAFRLGEVIDVGPDVDFESRVRFER